MKKQIIVILLLSIVVSLFTTVSGQIIIIESTPEFRFDTIESFYSYEGGGYRLKVTGTALYSGTISLGVKGQGVRSGSWVGGSQKEIIAGKKYTFYTDLEFHEILDANEYFTAEVFSVPSGFGSSTSQEFTYYLTDDDEESGAIYYNLKIIPVYAGTNDVAEFVNVCVDYGSKKSRGYGETNSIKLLKGTHRIYVENLGEYYSRYTQNSPYLMPLHQDTTLYIPIETSPNFQYNAYEEHSTKNNELSLTQIIISGVLILIIGIYFKKIL